MDDQKPEPVETVATDAATNQPVLTGHKTLQPSESLVQEMKLRAEANAQEQERLAAAQVAANAAPVTNEGFPAQTSNPQAAPTAVAAPTYQPTVSTPQAIPQPVGPITPATSIYPTVGQNGGFASQQASSSSAAASDDKKIVMAVQVVAGLMFILALSGLVDNVLLLRAHYFNIFGFIEAALELVLTVGLLLRRETARAIYVVLAIILLIIGVIGFVSASSEISRSNAARQTTARDSSSEVQNYDNQINSSTLSAPEKAQAIQNHNEIIANQKATIGSVSPFRLYATIAIGFLLSIFPLIFFTRPRIEAVFH